MKRFRRIWRGVARLRDLRLVRRSPFFDREWYLRNNADIARSGMDPALHFLLCGGVEGRNPGPDFCCSTYKRNNPDCRRAHANPLVHFHRRSKRSSADPMVARSPDTAGTDTLDALPVRPVRSGHRRVTIVTDRITAGPAGEGTAVAIILGSFWARHLDASLRIVTREAPAERNALAGIWRTTGMACDVEAEFIFAPTHAGRYDVDVGSQDVFLTTSWQTTWSTLQSVDARRISYLVQEDEGALCKSDAERRRRAETLADRDIGIVVSSRALFDRLRRENGAHIARSALWFDPDVPAEAGLPRDPATTDGAQAAWDPPLDRASATPDWSSTLSPIVARLAAA